jgi:hypothetical protein
MSYGVTQKNATYNYRKNHNEKYKEYHRKLLQKHYNWKKISQIFRNILL